MMFLHISPHRLRNQLEPVRRAAGTKTPTQRFNEQKLHSVQRGKDHRVMPKSQGRSKNCVTWLGSNPVVLAEKH